MNPETALRRRIHDMIKRQFPNTYIYHPSFSLVSGTPDFLICYKGHFIGMEIKTQVGVVSRLQEYVLERIRKAGGLSCVVRSVEEARQILLDIGK